MISRSNSAIEPSKSTINFPVGVPVSMPSARTRKVTPFCFSVSTIRVRSATGRGDPVELGDDEALRIPVLSGLRTGVKSNGSSGGVLIAVPSDRTAWLEACLEPAHKRAGDQRHHG